MSDVTVRSNEYLPDPDIKVSHNEWWYAASWEMEFGKQSDEHETPRGAESNQQVVTQKVANTNDETMTQQTRNNHTEDTNGVASSSSDFSNLTTDVGDISIYTSPPLIESPPILEITAQSCRMQSKKNSKVQITTQS